MSNDLFDTDINPELDPAKDYLVELVGEGKKFKDVNSLAKGKAESDLYVKHLLTQLDTLKQDLMARKRLEEIAETLGKQPATPQAPEPELREREPALAVEDLEELINKKLETREALKTRESNVREVMSTLKTALGPDYVDTLKAKGAELGLSQNEMNEMAATKPKLFLKLVGAENTPANAGNNLFVPPPQSQSAGFKPSVIERNKGFYDKLKKTDPNLYWRNDTQVQMHKDAVRLKDRFFD